MPFRIPRLQAGGVAGGDGESIVPALTRSDIFETVQSWIDRSASPVVLVPPLKFEKAVEVVRAPLGFSEELWATVRLKARVATTTLMVKSRDRRC